MNRQLLFADTLLHSGDLTMDTDLLDATQPENNADERVWALIRDDPDHPWNDPNFMMQGV